MTATHQDHLIGGRWQPSAAGGLGRFGGTAALHELTDLRWITVQRGERHYPI